MNEIWILDVRSYQWQFINTTFGGWGGGAILNSMPPPREMHISELIGGNIYVFGGKSHFSTADVDTVYNDLWRLNIETQKKAVLDGALQAELAAPSLFPVALMQGQRVFLAVDGSRAQNADTYDSATGIGSDNMCIDSLAIKVWA